MIKYALVCSCFFISIFFAQINAFADEEMHGEFLVVSDTAGEQSVIRRDDPVMLAELVAEKDGTAAGFVVHELDEVPTLKEMAALGRESEAGEAFGVQDEKITIALPKRGSLKNPKDRVFILGRGIGNGMLALIKAYNEDPTHLLRAVVEAIGHGGGNGGFQMYGRPFVSRSYSWFFRKHALPTFKMKLAKLLYTTFVISNTQRLGVTSAMFLFYRAIKYPWTQDMQLGIEPLITLAETQVITTFFSLRGLERSHLLGPPSEENKSARASLAFDLQMFVVPLLVSFLYTFNPAEMANANTTILPTGIFSAFFLWVIDTRYLPVHDWIKEGIVKPLSACASAMISPIRKLLSRLRAEQVEVATQVATEEP